MLPFLKKESDASVSVPVDVKERKPDNEEEYDGLESAAEDLISAIHSKDAKAVATAIRAAFDLCDSQPHVEGPHI